MRSSVDQPKVRRRPVAIDSASAIAVGYAGPLLSEAGITDGQWHRVGLVWDGSHRTLCVDGVAVAEDVQDALVSSDRGLYIGAGTDFAPDSFFSGLIDDVRIYSRAVKP